MPTLNIALGGIAKDKNGKQVPLPPPVALVKRGPVFQVTVSVTATIAGQVAQGGGTLPTPVTGWALIDTGATSTCVDQDAAQQLQLPVIDVVNVASASHATTQQNVYPIHIEAAGFPLAIDADRAIGAPLNAQGLLVLIGRDVLRHCVFVYNGITGSFSLSI